MFRYARVEFTDLDDANAPLFLDVLLDEQGKPKDGIPYLDWWGNHKSILVLPFIGEKVDDTYCLDFGSDEDTVQNRRYELCNFLHGFIEVGKRFKQRYGDDWYSLRVRRIVDMIEGREI